MSNNFSTSFLLPYKDCSNGNSTLVIINRTLVIIPPYDVGFTLLYYWTYKYDENHQSLTESYHVSTPSFSSTPSTWVILMENLNGRRIGTIHNLSISLILHVMLKWVRVTSITDSKGWPFLLSSSEKKCFVQ